MKIWFLPLLLLSSLRILAQDPLYGVMFHLYDQNGLVTKSDTNYEIKLTKRDAFAGKRKRESLLGEYSSTDSVFYADRYGGVRYPKFKLFIRRRSDNKLMTISFRLNICGSGYIICEIPTILFTEGNFRIATRDFERKRKYKYDVFPRGAILPKVISQQFAASILKNKNRSSDTKPMQRTRHLLFHRNGYLVITKEYWPNEKLALREKKKIKVTDTKDFENPVKVYSHKTMDYYENGNKKAFHNFIRKRSIFWDKNGKKIKSNKRTHKLHYPNSQ